MLAPDRSITNDAEGKPIDADNPAKPGDAPNTTLHEVEIKSRVLKLTHRLLEVAPTGDRLFNFLQLYKKVQRGVGGNCATGASFAVA